MTEKQVRRTRGPNKKPKTDRRAVATKLVDLAYKAPAYLGWGDHWELREIDSERLGAAASDCAATLDDKAVAKVERILDKVLPWLTLGYLGITLTVPRVQQTRALMQYQRQQDELRRRGAPHLEIHRATRADQSAPIVATEATTVPVTEGLIQETRPVDPFGGVTPNEARPGSDRGDQDRSNSDGPARFSI